MASYTDPPEEARGRRDLTVAGFFLALSVVLLYLPSGVQSRVSAVLQATALRPFLFTQEALAEARSRTEDALLLQAQLDSLAGLVASRASLGEENRRLQELLALEERDPPLFVAANAVRPGTAGSENMFVLDVGSDHGVRQGDPVLVRTGRIGLVGVVQEVRGGVSIALDWSHPDFRASAMSEDGRVYGFVQTSRGVFREQDRLLIDGIPFYEELEPGTLITTSGYGGVFPRGIPIGEVWRLREVEGGWRRSYWLRPIVETGSTTHVLVAVGGGLTEAALELLRGEVSSQPDSVGSRGPVPDPEGGGPVSDIQGGRPAPDAEGGGPEG
jgi:rod shape-determining protein MreC